MHGWIGAKCTALLRVFFRLCDIIALSEHFFAIVDNLGGGGWIPIGVGIAVIMLAGNEV